MRIVHVTDSYLPTLGGIELHVRDLTDRQGRAGHDVLVATRTPGSSEAASGRAAVVRVGGGRRDWLTEARPDVVHAHVSIISPFALAAARRAALAGLPTVVTVHSLWTHVGPVPAIARDLWGMRHWNLTWTAVSEQAAQPVRDLLGVPVHVVPNAVDLTRWTPGDQLPAEEPPHVLSVMRLTSVKRALPLVRTLRRAVAATDLTATIVGDGPERSAVQRYLRRHGMTDHVRLTGALDRREIRRLLRRTSAFVAPAHRESFGIAALEARASGVPVVASSRSGVATFIEHERDGLLGRDDRALGDQLVRLLQDDDLRQDITMHNRLVPTSFGWDSALELNLEAYELAAARAARGTTRRAPGHRVLVG